jgi:hypothetical protein
MPSYPARTATNSASAELRITSVFPCVARGFKACAASSSQIAAGGDRWLLTAVRGHLGDTHWARSYWVVQVLGDPASSHQVWWPATGEIRFEADYLPVWHEACGGYLDPATGELLPTWDQALDAIDPDDEPRHVVRFGAKFDAQGVLAGSKGSARCIGYLTKYLTKQLGDCHQPDTDAQREHMERLADALRFEPCSPTYANWLRYGIQPKNPRPGLVPGACKGKAHRYEHLGYAGRRVLVSRKWSGKTLADHRGDRRAWLTEMLGISATDHAAYRWEQVQPSDEDYLPSGRRLLRSVADRLQWENALAEARRRAQEALAAEVSAAGRAA